MKVNASTVFLLNEHYLHHRALTCITVDQLAYPILNADIIALRTTKIPH